MLRLQNVKAISVSWIKDGYSEVNVESRQRVLIQILLLLSFFSGIKPPLRNSAGPADRPRFIRLL